jgi:hypothetical protein
MSYRDELLEKTKAELIAIAEDYDIDVTRQNKDQIADAIIRFETGVPDDTVIEEVVAPVSAGAKVKEELTLVKFGGLNRSFQVGKFNFSVDHPFLAVPLRTASHVYRTWPKLFRPATPDEVAEYYG